MVEISEKLKNILKSIDDEEYFVINRPRQYGKTTTLYMIERFLKFELKICPYKKSAERNQDHFV